MSTSLLLVFKLTSAQVLRKIMCVSGVLTLQTLRDIKYTVLWCVDQYLNIGTSNTKQVHFWINSQIRRLICTLVCTNLGSPWIFFFLYHKPSRPISHIVAGTTSASACNGNYGRMNATCLPRYRHTLTHTDTYSATEVRCRVIMAECEQKCSREGKKQTKKTPVKWCCS